jgi:hypothetical protein
MAPIVSIIATKILAYEELTTCYDWLNSLTILGFLNKYLWHFYCILTKRVPLPKLL